MSATNAIHGIVLVGAILVAGPQTAPPDWIVGFIADRAGALNVFGGFAVTERMLQMFRRAAAPPKRTSSETVLAIRDVDIAYLITGSVHPRTAVSQLAADGALRQPARDGRHVHRTRRDARSRREPRLAGDRRSASAIGAAVGIYVGARGEDDRDAADGRALQRLRRRRGGARRDRASSRSLRAPAATLDSVRARRARALGDRSAR